MIVGSNCRKCDSNISTARSTQTYLELHDNEVGHDANGGAKQNAY